MSAGQKLHLVHILIRRRQTDGVGFLLFPHARWSNPGGRPYLSLPTKKTVVDPLAEFLQGTSIEKYVDDIMQGDLGLGVEDYALEQEIEPVEIEMVSPGQKVLRHYTIYPVDVWVRAECLSATKQGLNETWLLADEALAHPETSPTARAVFKHLREREALLERVYAQAPEKERQPEAPRRLLRDVTLQPSMDAMAKKWLSQNRGGVRHLSKTTLDAILATGDRAFNLRVADPYLRYQHQGLGFTWSFFTHKDPQDIHVHGAPVVEIYGVLEGRLEVWWKPYHDRGTSAWCHRIVEAGDWLEVDSLQCHIVKWLGEGKGVVFKAGPGPLAEVGKLGVKGKTPCKDCPCMKPPVVLNLARSQ